MASVGRASAMLASGTLVSRVLGFAKAWLLLQAIGALSFAGNAYSTATIVPNSIYAIIAQGILNAILVPQIVRASSHADGGKAYINKLVTLGIVVFAAVALVATLLSPVLMQLFGLRGPSRPHSATAFAYWSLPQIFFLGLYTLLGEVLNARKSFGPFTWAPVVNNVVAHRDARSSSSWPSAPTRPATASAPAGPPAMIALLAGGATLGVAVQALVLFFFWRRVGLRFRFDFRWRGVNLGHGGQGGAAGRSACSSPPRSPASSRPTSPTPPAQAFAGPLVMNNAWLIFMLPHGIIAVSIVTAFYTRMAEHAHRGDVDRRSGTDFSSGARSILLLIVFSSAALIVVAFPFARVFTLRLPADAASSSSPTWSAWCRSRSSSWRSAPSTPSATPARRSSSRSPRSPSSSSACSSASPSPPSLRAAAIALVVSIASVVQAVLAFALLRRRIGGVDGRRILGGLWRFLVAGARRVIAGAGSWSSSAASTAAHSRCPASSPRSSRSPSSAWSCSSSTSGILVAAPLARPREPVLRPLLNRLGRPLRTHR